MGTNYVYTDPAPVSGAPTGNYFHKRAVVTGVAGTLGSFISGGIPSFVDPLDAERTYYPVTVQLQVEAGSGLCYVTFDGRSTASATLGFQVAYAPAVSEIPFPSGLKDNTLSVFSPTTANVQCYFKMAPMQTR